MNFKLTFEDFDYGYLKSIQSIQGDTLSEKKKSIQILVNTIAENIKSKNKNLNEIKEYVAKHISIDLVPLVMVDISNKLKIEEGIIEALLSTNRYIFNRALKVKWFFDGTCKITTQPDLFDSKIFSMISFVNRMKLIKAISVHLINSDTIIAENLYDFICKKYNRNQAMFLLTVCSHKFIHDKLKKSFFRIPVNVMEKIIRKTPLILYHYLMDFFYINDEDVAVHKHLLVKIAPKYLPEFLEIIEYCLDKSIYALSSTKMKFCLKKHFTIFLKNPKLIDTLIDKNSPSLYISDENLKKIVLSSMPPNQKDFDFCDVWIILKRFSKNKNTLQIYKLAYKELYGTDLCYDYSNIEIDLVERLPEEERIYIAKKNMGNNFLTYTIDCSLEKSWVSLLPIKESISILKDRLYKCKNPYDKLLYFKYIVNSFKINNDTILLYDFINDIRKYYINEHTYVIFGIILHITNNYIIDDKLFFLIENILLDLYHTDNISYDKSKIECEDSEDYSQDIHLDFYSMRKLFRKLLIYKLNISNDIQEFKDMFTMINIEYYDYNFIKKGTVIDDWHAEYIYHTILLDELEKKIDFIKSLPRSQIYCLFTNLYQNTRTLNNSKICKFGKSIDMYKFSGIIELTKDIINDLKQKQHQEYMYFIKYVYRVVPDIIKIDSNLFFYLPIVGDILKKDYKQIEEKVYVINTLLLNKYKKNRYAYFLWRSCMWYKDLSFVVINNLIENFTLTSFSCDNQYINKSDKRCVTMENIKDIIQSLKVSDNNIPIQQIKKLLLKYPQENVSDLIKKYPMNQVRECISDISMDNENTNIWLKKKAIQISYINLPKLDFEIIILQMYNELVDPKINNLFCKWVFKFFISNPKQSTFTLIKRVINLLRPDDNMWKLILQFKLIDMKFLNNYVIEIIKVINNFKIKELKKDYFRIYYFKIFSLLSNEDFVVSDKLHQLIFESIYKNYKRIDIIKYYQCDNYLIFNYLMGADKNFIDRLETLIELFFSDKDILDSKSSLYRQKIDIVYFYVISYIINQKKIEFKKWKLGFERFKQSYLSVFTPFSNPRIYIMLSFWHSEIISISIEEITEIIKLELPKLLKIFGESAVLIIAKNFSDTFKVIKNLKKNEWIKTITKLCNLLFDTKVAEFENFASFLLFQEYCTSYIDKYESSLERMSTSSFTSVKILYNFLKKRKIKKKNN